MRQPQYTEEFWEKIECIVRESEAIIDRPKGSRHPRYPSIIYPVDYGCLKGTSSPDGGGIDIWAGTAVPRKVSGIICTVDIVKKDSEIKILIGCSDEEIRAVYEFHNESDYMKGLLFLREPGPETDR